MGERGDQITPIGSQKRSERKMNIFICISYTTHTRKKMRKRTALKGCLGGSKLVGKGTGLEERMKDMGAVLSTRVGKRKQRRSRKDRTK